MMRHLSCRDKPLVLYDCKTAVLLETYRFLLPGYKFTGIPLQFLSVLISLPFILKRSLLSLPLLFNVYYFVIQPFESCCYPIGTLLVKKVSKHYSIK